MKYKLVNEKITEDYGRNLLRARGIENIDLFLHPDPTCLQSWEDLDNISKSAAMVLDRILDNKPWAIVADCDTDGACSFAIIYQYLKRLNAEKEIKFFIHTGKQHGFSDMMDNLMDTDWGLIIAPDSATNDGQYIEQFNCPVLVLDHHLKEESSKIPLNMFFVNNQESQFYKNKDLCGAGVTWQFCRALDYYSQNDWAKDYIDLCALAEIGDMMSVLNYENQYLIQTGLHNIKNTMFKVLLDKQDYSMGGKINPTTVAFYIVPLINAMIRVGSQEEKERLYRAFVEPNVLVDCHKRGAKGTKERLCVESARECTNAKAKQDREKEKIVQELEVKIFKQDLLENQILFVRLDDDDEFPAELNGLCAMVLSAKYHKPTILARRNSEGYDRGSIRAPSNTAMGSFKEYLNNTGLFEYVMGHDAAAGCSIADKNLSKLHEIANKELSKIDFRENIYDVNFIIDANDRILSFLIGDLSQYEDYCGQQNPEPQICVTNILVSSNEVSVIGKNKDTIRIEKNGVTYIKFHAKELIQSLQKYDKMNLTIIGRPNINDWLGHLTPQLLITDMEIEDARFSF